MATFFDLPEVAQEKIYRFLDIPSQTDFFEAFNGTSHDHVLDRIKVHRQEISCWICQIQQYLTDFWPVSQPYSDNGLPRGPMVNEPKFETRGFDFLYKYLEEKDGRVVYVPRDRTNPEDIQKMNQIFDAFVEKISSVFKAKSPDELRAHIKLEHETPFFVPKFFEMYFKMQGNIFKKKYISGVWWNQ